MWKASVARSYVDGGEPFVAGQAPPGEFEITFDHFNFWGLIPIKCQVVKILGTNPMRYAEARYCPVLILPVSIIVSSCLVKTILRKAIIL